MIALDKFRISAIAVLAFTLSASMGDRAFASFIVDESGTVAFPAPNSTVQYAVYENTTPSDWTTGLLSGGLTAWNLDVVGSPVALSGAATTAAYIYLYEVTNLSNTIIEQLQLQGSSLSGVSSFGFIATTSSRGALDASGGVFGPGSSITTGSGRTPTGADMVAPPDVPIANLAFEFDRRSAGQIPVGGNSVILFLTSNDGPGVGVGGVFDTILFSFESLPVPTPVPATLALLLSGLPAALGFGIVKNRGRSRISNKA